MRIIWVGVGGFAGSALRYWLSGVVLARYPGTALPWPTIVVNLTGCLVIGVLAGAAESRELLGPDARAFVFAGLLGGFTTFSAFALETVNSARTSAWQPAMLNVAISVVAGVALCWLGRAAIVQVLR